MRKYIKPESKMQEIAVGAVLMSSSGSGKLNCNIDLYIGAQHLDPSEAW